MTESGTLPNGESPPQSSARRGAGRPRPGWLPDIGARCTGCGWCVAACEPHVLSLEVVQWKKRSVLHDADRCTGCSDCAIVCPFHVIVMRKGKGAFTAGA